MLKIAVTKGRIERDFCKLLERSGYDISPILNKDRKLIIDTKDGVEYVFVKASDVTTYLDYGVVDLGVVGKDSLIEKDCSKYVELADLKIGKCKFCLASKGDYKNKKSDGKEVIATKYPKLTKQFFSKKSSQVEIVNLNGSIEVAPVLDMADAIVDLVETGDTLRANGLEIIEEICDVSTRLVANKDVADVKKDEFNNFVKSLKIDM